uniref:Ovule protein n=1 Tax=Ascaris lumbricoides TaxID=6252 RepID=A0A0M3IVQ7_ASCLU
DREEDCATFFKKKALYRINYEKKRQSAKKRANVTRVEFYSSKHLQLNKTIHTLCFKWENNFKKKKKKFHHRYKGKKYSSFDI